MHSEPGSSAGTAKDSGELSQQSEAQGGVIVANTRAGASRFSATLEKIAGVSRGRCRVLAEKTGNTAAWMIGHLRFTRQINAIPVCCQPTIQLRVFVVRECFVITVYGLESLHGHECVMAVINPSVSLRLRCADPPLPRTEFCAAAAARSRQWSRLCACLRPRNWLACVCVRSRASRSSAWGS